MDPTRRKRWRKVRHLALYGFLPLLIGIGLLADAFHRKPAPVPVASDDAPARLRGIPWDQQSYWLEVGLGSIFVLVGGLAANAILTPRR